jgi:peptidoglycan/LPS O-acetylase OafA/YrhL
MVHATAEGAVPAAVSTLPPFPVRIGMLDGWRGLAAMAVLLQHLGLWSIGVPAVMLFFVISGYCIAASAHSCLRTGMPIGQFVRRRIRRIYPPYLFSVGFFLLTRVVKSFVSPAADQLARTPVEYVQNLTLTQWLTLLKAPEVAAYENPTLFVTSYWSLCYEEQFYLLIALMLVLAKTLKQSIFAWVGGFAVLAAIWNFRNVSLSYGIFLDYWLHFAIGVLVFYRLCQVQTAWGRRVADAGLVAMAIFSACMLWRSGEASGVERFVYREWLVASLFAVFLIVSRPLDDKFNASLAGRMLKGLGLISFSLYLIHQFNMIAIRKVVVAVLPHSLGFLQLGFEVACHLALAATFWHFCERPFLSRPSPGPAA